MRHRPIAQSALEFAARSLHSKHAASLPFGSWSDAHGRSFRLIEDEEVRNYYGRVIGMVAESHWWPIEEVEARLRTELLTAPPWLPSSWTVDGLELAAVLRIADAAQVDQSRAPGFLGTLRRPQA